MNVKGLSCKVQDAETPAFQAASWFGHLALSAMGPCGRSKVLQANESSAAGSISSISYRLLSGIRTSDLVSKLLLQTSAHPQCLAHGDGGLLCLHVASALLTHGLRTSPAGASRLLLVRACQRCMKDVASALGQKAQEEQKHAAVKTNDGVNSSSSSSSSDSDSDSSSECGPEVVASWASVSSDDSGTSSSSGSSPSSTLSSKNEGGSIHAERSGRSTQKRRLRHARVPQAHSAWMAPCFSLLGAGAYAYIALVRSVLGSKQVCGLSADSLDRACLLLVQAFLTAQPQASPSTHPGAATGNIRLLTVPGLQPRAWDVIDGLVLDASGLKHALSARLPVTQPSCMALFGVSLAPGALTASQGSSHHARAEGPTISGAPTVCEAEVGQEWSPAAAEVDILINLMHNLRALGVRVVACQKVVHEKVQHAALQLGMLPLQRLSAQHASSLSSISGALPINSWHPPGGPASMNSSWKHMLGVVGSIDIQASGQHSHLIFRPILAPGESAPASCPWACQAPGAHSRLMRQHMGAGSCSSRGRVQTLLLGAATQAGCDELRTAAEGALRVLTWTLRSPWVLPGGGAWQAMVAAHLRAKARVLERRHKHIKAGVYTAMAGALEQAAISLIPHSAERTQDVREGVRSAARSAPKQLASSLSKGCPAAHVEYIGWCHAKAQLTAVAAVEVHVPSLKEATCLPDCHQAQRSLKDPTSLHAHGVGTRASAHPSEEPLLAGGYRQHSVGGWPVELGSDLRRAPEASRILGTIKQDAAHQQSDGHKQIHDGGSDVGAHVRASVIKYQGRLISAHLLDSAPAMVGALASGVDAACMLLRVDTLVAEH